jgi:hypothetical protein
MLRSLCKISRATRNENKAVFSNRRRHTRHHNILHVCNYAEAQVRARASLCGICGGQSGTGIGFSPTSSVSPVSIIPPWLSMLIYQLVDEHGGRSSEMVSPHRHEQQEV